MAGSMNDPSSLSFSANEEICLLSTEPLTVLYTEMHHSICLTAAYHTM